MAISSIGEFERRSLLSGRTSSGLHRLAQEDDGGFQFVVQFLQAGVLRNRPAQQFRFGGGQFAQQQRGDARFDLFA